jgi:hypothetical protein
MISIKIAIQFKDMILKSNFFLYKIYLIIFII